MITQLTINELLRKQGWEEKSHYSLFQHLGFGFLQREAQEKGETVVFAEHLSVPGTGYQSHHCLAGHFSKNNSPGTKDVRNTYVYGGGTMRLNKTFNCSIHKLKKLHSKVSIHIIYNGGIVLLPENMATEVLTGSIDMETQHTYEQILTQLESVKYHNLQPSPPPTPLETRVTSLHNSSLISKLFGKAVSLKNINI